MGCWCDNGLGVREGAEGAGSRQRPWAWTSALGGVRGADCAAVEAHQVSSRAEGRGRDAAGGAASPPRRWPRASGGRGDSGTAGGRTQPAVGRGTQFGQEAELRHMGGGGPQLGRSPARIRPSTPLFFSSRERNLCLCRTRPVSTGRRPRAWLCWARAGRPGVGDGPEPACTPRPHRAGRGRSPSLAGDAAPCGTLSCPREASRGDVHVHLREAPPRTRPAAAASAEAWGTHGAAGEGVPAAVPGARGVQPPSPVRTRPPSPLPGCGSWTLRRCPRTRGLLASSP